MVVPQIPRPCKCPMGLTRSAVEPTPLGASYSHPLPLTLVLRVQGL